MYQLLLKCTVSRGVNSESNLLGEDCIFINVPQLKLLEFRLHLYLKGCNTNGANSFYVIKAIILLTRNMYIWLFHSSIFAEFTYLKNCYFAFFLFLNKCDHGQTIREISPFLSLSLWQLCLGRPRERNSLILLSIAVRCRRRDGKVNDKESGAENAAIE